MYYQLMYKRCARIFENTHKNLADLVIRYLSCITLTAYCGDVHQFKCANGQCILRSQRCDNQTDCDDDESNCYGNCAEDQHRCANQQCLDISNARCDGIAQCRDLSDERGCGM